MRSMIVVHCLWLQQIINPPLMLQPEDSFVQHNDHRRAVSYGRNIYYLLPLMCSICADGAFETVASVCVLWFLDQQIQTGERLLNVPSPPAG